MSAAALPTPTDAYKTLFNDVAAKVFFHKVAATIGVTPRTDAEAQAMLDTSEKLKFAEAQAATKQASAAENPILRMHAGVNAVLAEHGFPVSQPETAAAYKQAAADLAEDPAIFNAVLSLRAHQAAQVIGA